MWSIIFQLFLLLYIICVAGEYLCEHQRRKDKVKRTDQHYLQLTTYLSLGEVLTSIGVIAANIMAHGPVWLTILALVVALLASNATFHYYKSYRQVRRRQHSQ